jgi:uncharacterized protein YoxC
MFAALSILAVVATLALQIALIVAVFRTSRAAQETASLLRRLTKEVRFIADVAEEVRPPPVMNPVR